MTALTCCSAGNHVDSRRSCTPAFAASVVQLSPYGTTAPILLPFTYSDIAYTCNRGVAARYFAGVYLKLTVTLMGLAEIAAEPTYGSTSDWVTQS